jgi:uncharacterized protein
MLPGGLWAALLPVVLWAGQDSVRPVLPPPSRYVADYAGVVDAAHQSELNGMLQRLELTTGVQYIILTTRSTQGEPLSRFAKRVAVQWKLRQRGRERGLLFVLAPDDKTYCLELGPELREVLGADFLARLADEVLEPSVLAGEMSEGVYRYNERIAQRLASHYGVSLSEPLQSSLRGTHRPASGPSGPRMGWVRLVAIAGVTAGLALLVGRFRRRRIRARLQHGRLAEAAFLGLQRPCQGGCFGGGFGAFGAGAGGPGSGSGLDLMPRSVPRV